MSKPMVGARITVLTGFIAGSQLTLSGEVIVGRNEDVDLRFDPLQDLNVSGRHAAFTQGEDHWFIQDLGSLNGTFVNGQRLTGPVHLQDGDEIQLGDGGPLLEFHLLAEAMVAPAPETVGSPPPGIGGGMREPRGVRGPVALLSVVLLAVILVATYFVREGRRYREQVEAMQERIDSILDASAETAGALQGRIQGLHDALLDSRRNLEAVRYDLEVAEEAGDSEEAQILRVQLQEAQVALVRHQLAANLDFDAIEAGNRRAVAKVFVDFGGEVVTATAFSVRSDATFMTNRHVVAGTSGTRNPQRIAIQFADSRQVWPARVLATSITEDLALLKVDNIVGEVPTISGFNERPGSVQSGQGVGVIGFPLGGADPAEGAEGSVARTTLTAGIVQAVRPDMLEVNGYGVEGSSGSPVFDGEGKVVGVLFGGRVVNGERTLFAVPANRAIAFLRGIS
ncbi:MAG: FHA domain-containing protein [Gemmatimonadota bacterium]